MADDQSQNGSSDEVDNVISDVVNSILTAVEQELSPQQTTGEITNNDQRAQTPKKKQRIQIANKGSSRRIPRQANPSPLPSSFQSQQGGNAQAGPSQTPFQSPQRVSNQAGLSQSTSRSGQNRNNRTRQNNTNFDFDELRSMVSSLLESDANRIESQNWNFQKHAKANLPPQTPAQLARDMINQYRGIETPITNSTQPDRISNVRQSNFRTDFENLKSAISNVVKSGVNRIIRSKRRVERVKTPQAPKGRPRQLLHEKEGKDLPPPMGWGKQPGPFSKGEDGFLPSYEEALQRASWDPPPRYDEVVDRRPTPSPLARSENTTPGPSPDSKFSED